MQRSVKVTKKIPSDVLPAPQAQAVINSLPQKGESITIQDLVQKVQDRIDNGEIVGDAQRVTGLYVYTLRKEGFVEIIREPKEKPEKTPRAPKAEKPKKAAKSTKAAKSAKSAEEVKTPKPRKTVTTTVAA